MRNQPKDTVYFAVEYFKCLQQGLILDYLHRGQNIPCIFKPAIPKIPELLKNQSPKKEIKQEKKEEIKQEKKEEKKIFDKNLKLDKAIYYRSIWTLSIRVVYQNKKCRRLSFIQISNRKLGFR